MPTSYDLPHPAEQGNPMANLMEIAIARGIAEPYALTSGRVYKEYQLEMEKELDINAVLKMKLQDDNHG